MTTIRPPYGQRDELHIILPCGHAVALIPERHAWTGDSGSGFTVTPSIVCHAADFHGFLVEGLFTP